ncbi:hypothetical protein ABXV18_26915 [Vibrio owensii]|uniref:hypothetical protein n=1 Tax=Vibrio owensii TaxID=696485 RepID=UPI003391E6CF
MKKLLIILALASSYVQAETYEGYDAKELGYIVSTGGGCWGVDPEKNAEHGRLSSLLDVNLGIKFITTKDFSEEFKLEYAGSKAENSYIRRRKENWVEICESFGDKYL